MLPQRCSRVHSLRLRKRWVGIHYRRQISRARTRIQVRQQSEVAWLRLQLAYPAVRIIDIAEHDRVRRARLLACCLEFITDARLRDLRRDASAVDALHTI